MGGLAAGPATPPIAFRSFHCSARRPSAAHLTLPRGLAKPWRSSKSAPERADYDVDSQSRIRACSSRG